MCPRIPPEQISVWHVWSTHNCWSPSAHGAMEFLLHAKILALLQKRVKDSEYRGAFAQLALIKESEYRGAFAQLALIKDSEYRQLICCTFSSIPDHDNTPMMRL